MIQKSRPSILLVANWDSDVGYAWWLMESFWVSLSHTYSNENNILLAYPNITRIPKKIQKAPIRTVQCNFKSRSLPALIKILCFLKKNRVSWIYFTDKPSMDWIYPLYRLAGVRAIIIHDHTPGTREAPVSLKKWIKHCLAGTVFAADGLIAVTEYVRNRHLEVYCFPAEKCMLAANGIRLGGPVEEVDLQSRFGIPAGRKVMVMTGRANLYKGIDFILHCLSLLVHDRGRSDVHFLFCGDGPDLEYFIELGKELKIDKFVTFAGRCPDVPSILSACDFAIHASKGEVGYSLSILEYMYAALPVIVPSNPSVCGATDDKVNGFIYTDQDTGSAADVIEYLLDNPDVLHKTGENARETVIRDFNLDDTHKQLLTAVTNILFRKHISQV